MAARFWIGGGTNTNWNASPTTNWSATSGGAVRVAAPTVADDVTFDGAGAGGNTNSIISATISCLSLTITAGYTATMTHNAVLTIAGNVTLNTSYTIAGSASMTISAASTITSNGKTWPNSMTWTGISVTKTLVGDFTISNILTIQQSNVLNKTTSESLTVGNGLVLAGSITGTATLNLGGGTWSCANSNCFLAVPTLITGAVTFSGIVYLTAGSSMSVTTGSITSTGATLYAINSTTLDLGATTLNKLSIQQGTITLTTALTATTIELTINSGNVIFAGLGFTCSTFSALQVTATTVTLKEAITYTITTLLSCFTTSTGSSLLFTSAHGTTKAIMTLSWGATCRCKANFTRIDASGGRPIRSFNSTITDCSYIQNITDLKTVAA